jgi:hypothetical protein
MTNYLFFYIALFSSVIPVILIGVLQRSNTIKSKLSRVFFLFILVRALTDMGSLILEKVISNSFPIFHFSIPIQFALILELFFLIHHSKIPKSIFLFLVLVFFTLDLTLTSNIMKNNHVSTMYTYTIISGFGIRYLFNMKGDYFQRIIFSSISLYSIAFTFLLFFEEIIFTTKELIIFLLNFMALLSLVLNLLFSYALCLKLKN